MSDPTQLDVNLEKLLAVAPARACLDGAARERIRRALRDAAKTTPDSVHSPRTPRPVARALVAVAAALALAIVGIRALLSDGEEPGDVDLATADDVARDVLVGGEPGGELGWEPGDPASRARSSASEPELASPEQARAERSASDAIDAEPADREGEVGGEGAATDAGARDDLVARIAFEAPSLADGGGRAEPPTSIVLWVKPMVDLPRVADPVAHAIDLGGTARESVQASIEGALTPARAMGSREVLVQAEAEGFAPERALVTLEEMPGVVDFKLTRGITFEGFVVDAQSQTPLEGAVVVAIDQLPLDGIPVAPESGLEGFPRPATTTDANGAFRLDHVAPEASVRLRASATGFAPTVETLRTSASPVRFELRAGGTVRGVCEREDGTRWSGALVIASRQTADPTLSVRPPMTFGMAIADATGEYRIGDLPPGSYVVLLFGEPQTRMDGPVGFKQTLLSGDEEIEVDFLARPSATGSSLTGRLVHADGSPAPKTTLTLMRVGGRVARDAEWSATETDAEGRFTFGEALAGEYVLHGASQSFARMELVWHGVIDGPTERTVTLAATEWTLACRSAEGVPREGAWAILELEADTSGKWIFAGRGPTDADGEIVFQGLPPGRYRATIAAVERGDGQLSIDPVSVLPERPVRLDVELPPGDTLVVEVVGDQTQSAVEGAAVAVRDAAGVGVQTVDTVKTDLDGLASTPGVAFGAVQIVVRAPGGALSTVRLDFVEGGSGTPETPLRVVIEGR